MKRPMVNTSPVADQYASKDRERIVEFSSGAPGGPGGLISFRQLDDGTLSVSLYRLDDGVIVHVSDERDGRKIRKTRVIGSTGDPGRWQAQYFDPAMSLWFDIGDSATTENEANAKAAAYQRGE